MTWSWPVGLSHLPPGPVVVAPACRAPGVDPEWFFPARDSSSVLVARAKAVCAGCAEREVCRSWALACGDLLHGIWGGTSGRDRRNLRRGAVVTSEGITHDDEDEGLVVDQLDHLADLNEELDQLSPPETLDDLAVAEEVRTCAICKGALPVERRKVNAKTCARESCQKEWRITRDRSRKLRAATNGAGPTNGAAPPVVPSALALAVTPRPGAPKSRDGIGPLLEELVGTVRHHPGAAVTVRLDGVRVRLKATG